jgi:hypothetical protein
MRTRIALAALSAVAGLGALVGFAGQANAASTSADSTTTGYIKQYTTSYTGPSTTASVVHTGLAEETPVDVRCFREGEKINGNGYWFLVEKGGDLGYVHRDAIWAPHTTPHC